MSLRRYRRSGVGRVVTGYNFGLTLTLTLTSLWRSMTKPPFLHANAYSMVTLVPHPLQHFYNSNSSNNSNLYLRCIASLHSSFDRDSALTVVGVMEIHAPVSILWVVGTVGIGLRHLGG